MIVAMMGSDVEAFAVPHSRLVQRGQQPAIVRDQRVIIASRSLRGTARACGRCQREAGEKDAALVYSLDEAYEFLALRKPLFEPFEQG